MYVETDPHFVLSHISGVACLLKPFAISQTIACSIPGFVKAWTVVIIIQELPI